MGLNLVDPSMRGPSWEYARWLIQKVDDHYGLMEQDQEALFHAIWREPRPNIVEIGVCHGRTSVMLAYLARCNGGVYHGIDDFSLESSPGAWLETMRQVIGGEHPVYRLHVGSSNGYRGKPMAIQPAALAPIDILFIDGGHDEGNIKLDCELWLPHVARGGIVAFDDWTDRSAEDGDPHWAVGVYSRQHTADWQVFSRPGAKVYIVRKPL